MTKRMLIDATHAEETRVVVLDGNRLEDFDVETAAKRQLKGNIYLAKVVRVEPSLQAAFVEYGGGRHGFLAFGEIHPDYYQIPVADRQRLLRLQEEEALAEAAEEEEEARASGPRRRGAPEAAAIAPPGHGEIVYGAVEHGALALDPPMADQRDAEADREDDIDERDGPQDVPEADMRPPETVGGGDVGDEGSAGDEARTRRMARFLRNYRIQEVIRRRQIMLVQVEKEERGTKGAALTTYISLAGRFCVLMPNSPRGGGISRKITSAADRRRLKEITAELEIPPGMGLIVRTAGANRPKPEIRRDCEYLMRLWDDIREHTLRSIAPALIYEEATLIKRAMRDGYSRDIDEVLVDGQAGWKMAHDFMRMLMPSHAKKVQLWRPEGQGQPLFSKFGVEDQLDSMLSPTVQLKSGGYLVINQAEALVAIDVNSGRATRERGIEETALRTNLEAADEAARQLRLRDLAGLIVIDFIDMEARKHNAMVEKRLKDALKSDRARIQVGHISHFGLLEMSRQRLRPSLTEASFVTCPHCGGFGMVRNVESAALHVLRDIEDEGAKGRAGHIMVHVASAVAMYVLNHKRDRLAEIEARYAMRVHLAADDALVSPQVRIDRLKPPLTDAERLLLVPPPVAPAAPLPMSDDEEVAEEAPDVIAPEVSEIEEAGAAVVTEPDRSGDVRSEEDHTAQDSGDEEDDRPRRRRRRRRSGRRDETEDDGSAEATADAESTAPGAALADSVALAPVPEVAREAIAPPAAGGDDPIVAPEAGAESSPAADPEALDEDGMPRGRRRGRRGGRRRRREDEPAGEAVDPTAEDALAAVVSPPPSPAHRGPTPADPYGGQALDIFDLLERAEQAEQAPKSVAPAGLTIPPVPPDAAAPTELPAEAQESEPVAAKGVDVVAPDPGGAATEPSRNTVAAPQVVAAEPETAPAVRPIVLGADPLPTAERKRGWWRR